MANREVFEAEPNSDLVVQDTVADRSTHTKQPDRSRLPKRAKECVLVLGINKTSQPKRLRRTCVLMGEIAMVTPTGLEPVTFSSGG